MRRLLAVALFAVALAGCGGVSYKPEAGGGAPKASGSRLLTVVTPHMHVDASWRAAGLSGTAVAVERTLADKFGDRRITLRLLGTPRRGPVEVSVRAFLPWKTETIVRMTGRTHAPVVLTPADGRVRGCTERRLTSCPAPAPPATAKAAAGTVWVAADGDDNGGDGTETRPYRTIDRALADDATRHVLVRDGDYPTITDARERTDPVVIEGADATRPRVAGAILTGSRHLRLRGLHLTDSLVLSDRDPVQDFELSDSEVTVGDKATGVSIGEGSEDVRIRYNWIHDSRYGISNGYSGDEDAPVARGIRIEGNQIENMIGDGIQFVDWSDVVIAHNVITELHAGTAADHNDGVQIVGGSSHVRIVGNLIANSDNQLILIGESLGGRNSDILVENNLLHDAGSWAIHNQGVEGVRVISNTIWHNKGGALLLGAGKYGAATDTVIADNVLDFLFQQRGGKAGRQVANFIAKAHGGAGLTASDIGGDPGFAPGGYVPGKRSALRGRGDASLAPPVDLFGLRRAAQPTIGAFR